MKKTLLFILCTLFSINVFGQVSMKDVEESCKNYKSDWENSAIKLYVESSDINKIEYKEYIEIKDKSKEEIYIICNNIFNKFNQYNYSNIEYSDVDIIISKCIYFENIYKNNLFYIDIHPFIMCSIFDDCIFINCFLTSYYVNIINKSSGYDKINNFFPYNLYNLIEYQNDFAEIFVKSSIYCKLTVEYIKQNLIKEICSYDISNKKQ